MADGGWDTFLCERDINIPGGWVVGVKCWLWGEAYHSHARCEYIINVYRNGGQRGLLVLVIVLWSVSVSACFQQQLVGEMRRGGIGVIDVCSAF